MRSALLDVTPIIAATTCNQRNYVERYSRYRGRKSIGGQRMLFSWPFFGWCGNATRRSANDVGRDWPVNERSWRTHYLPLCRSDRDHHIALPKAETMGG